MDSRHVAVRRPALHRTWLGGVSLAVLMSNLSAPAHAIVGPGRFDLTEPDDSIDAGAEAPPFRELRRTLADTTPQVIPHTPAGELLQTWIVAHNKRSAASLRHWLRTSLNPTVSDAEVDKRLGWYVDAIDMFGPLSQEPLAVVEDAPNRLLVHLVRSDLGPRERLDPLNIVVVELDVDVNDPRYLARGLGLGALACEARPDEEKSARER
jgi:hypothetical protein